MGSNTKLVMNMLHYGMLAIATLLSLSIIGRVTGWYPIIFLVAAISIAVVDSMWHSVFKH